MITIAEELEKLNNLKQIGALSDKEYEEAKASLLAQNRPAGQKLKHAMDGVSSDTNMWGMFIHLSQFCGYVIPLAGLIVPIVLWQMKKDESDIIDRHGRIVVNWIITEIIFGILFALLCLVLIGIPLLFALCVVAIIFPIVGGLKANDGEVWRYPCSIDFFTVD
ncbi:MAG: DUF4870 domain-containing protein [Verrucomicrobiales bacterium]